MTPLLKIKADNYSIYSYVPHVEIIVFIYSKCHAKGNLYIIIVIKLSI